MLKLQAEWTDDCQGKTDAAAKLKKIGGTKPEDE